MESKVLVLLFDGTWNGLEEGAETNIARLYRNLTETAGSNYHLKYLHGVGNGWGSLLFTSTRLLDRISGGWIDMILGGALGWGVSRQVREGYTFLVEQYEPGCRIYVLGFSRGAFAARSLVGLVKHAGILKSDERALIGPVAKAYHRRNRSAKYARTLAESKSSSHCNVRVDCVGVFDTVGALGVPIWGGDFRLNPFARSSRFHDVNAWDIVNKVFHALAIDEQRAAYLPVMCKQNGSNCQIEQVWFRGMHSDVGGGYDNTSLSSITLAWMTKRLKEEGLQVDIPQEKGDSVALKSLETLPHDSLGEWWRFGVWPRWRPICESTVEKDYMIDWGYNHESVKGLSHLKPKLKLIDLAVDQTHQVYLPASAFFVDTGVIIWNSRQYEFEVSGASSLGPRFAPKCKILECFFQRFLRDPDCKLGESVGLICRPLSARPSGKAFSGAYGLWRTPREFKIELFRLDRIGRDSTPENGILCCFLNSRVSRQRRNTGGVTLKVRRVS